MASAAITEERTTVFLEAYAATELQSLEAAELNLATSDHELTTLELAEYFEQRVRTNSALIELYDAREMPEYEKEEGSGFTNTTPKGKAMHENTWLETFAARLRTSESIESFKSSNAGTSNSKDVAEELYFVRAHVKHKDNTVDTISLERVIAELIGDDKWQKIVSRELKLPNRASLDPLPYFESGF
ncbi:MAG: hypothetical protein ACD_24C00523G0001 [uncultured bacterium]|nr:MAG: hypothetical protein ACD_24C00523G0001 [uncultured bacterium]